jgi:hypothetical protein
MKLSKIIENKWIRVTGGANGNDPDYVWPYSHPHSVEEAGADWYHGTTDAFLDSILEHGLDTYGKGADRAGHGLGNPVRGNPENHVTKNINLARSIAKKMSEIYGGNPIILELDFTGTNIELIGSKTDSSTEKVVPASAIIKVRRVRKLRDK